MNKVVKVEKGNGGWGGPLFLECEGKRNKIVSMTGGGINELASHIAESIDGEAVDGFKHTPNDDEIVCVIINCVSTLRCGIYPQKKLYTINLNAICRAETLAEHIVDKFNVAGVKKRNVKIKQVKNEEEASVVSKKE